MRLLRVAPVFGFSSWAVGSELTKKSRSVTSKARPPPRKAPEALPTTEAQQLATEAGMDLVEVAPNEKPPVCRIMDYGKFKYEQKKKREGNKPHHVSISSSVATPQCSCKYAAIS